MSEHREERVQPATRCEGSGTERAVLFSKRVYPRPRRGERPRQGGMRSLRLSRTALLDNALDWEYTRVET